jgi:hypothetical protein
MSQLSLKFALSRLSTGWRQCTIVLGCALLGFFVDLHGTRSLIAAGPTAAPTATYVLPAGGRRGATVDVVVSGTNLTGVVAARLSGGNLSAELLEAPNATTARLRIAIDSAAELGEYDLRLISPGGASNRLRFVVGDVAELSEIEPNNERPQAQKLANLPVVINGQILAEDTDSFRFTAKAGQHLVFAAVGRQLHPYGRIDDRVGWFDPCLMLFNSEGKELAFVDDVDDNPDPVLIHKVAQDGEYMIALRDNLYRGRNEFVYRLVVGAVPYITHLDPLGGHRDSFTRLKLSGANVPAEFALHVTADSPPLKTVRVAAGGIHSNAMPYAVDDFSEYFELGDNNKPEQAQHVAAPVAINGRIEKAGDEDCFSLTLGKGERYIIEALSHRLGSPLDSVVQVLNSKGNQLAANDDAVAGELQLVRADARIDFTVPADGDYVIRIKDFLKRGGNDFGYRIVVRPLRPSFALQVSPDNPRLDQQGTCLLTVEATREEGFADEIGLAVEGLPPGVVASAPQIGPTQNSALITLTAGASAPLGVMVLPLRVVGTGTGNPDRRIVASGIERIQYVNNQVLSVPVREIALGLTPTPASCRITIDAVGPLEIRRDAKRDFKVRAVRRMGVSGPIAVSLQGLPKDITAPPVVIAADQSEATLTISAADKAPLGAFSAAVIGKITFDNKLTSQSAAPLSLQVTAAEPVKK